MDPPRGFNLSQTLLDVGDLQADGLVDAGNVADSPRTQGRMSALFQLRLGIETVMHLEARHCNLVGPVLEGLPWLGWRAGSA